MHLAIDIRHLGTREKTGVGQYTQHVLEHLMKVWPGKITLFSSGRPHVLEHLPDVTEYPNVSHYHYPRPNKLLNAKLLFPFSKPLEAYLDEQPDIWWFPNHNIIKTKIPYAITLHDLSFMHFPECFTFRQQLRHRLARINHLISNARIILSVSRKTKDDVCAAFPHVTPRIRVTHLGAAKRYHPGEQPADKGQLSGYGIQGPYLLSLCTLEPRKNISAIIEAYDRWRASLPPGAKTYKLVIAGARGWKSRHIMRTAQTRRYHEDIQFIRYVDEAHKPALYRHAHALIFPSLYEGFGLPVLEAMMCGTPVITHAQSSLPEIASHHALYVQAHNVTELTQALHHVTSDAVTHQLLTMRGRVHAEQFTWKATAEKTCKALQEILQ